MDAAVEDAIQQMEEKAIADEQGGEAEESEAQPAPAEEQAPEPAAEEVAASGGEAEGGDAATDVEQWQESGSPEVQSSEPYQPKPSAEWPPKHCKHLLKPAGRPVVAGASKKGLRRSLLSEAPTELVLAKKPPTEEERDYLYRYIYQAMGTPPGVFCNDPENCPKAPPPGEDGKPYIGKDPCMFLTQLEECQDDIERGLGAKKVDAKSLPPGLGLGSLGSCAFVATGDSVLQAEYGPAIDAHDSVIRYNTPIKGFEKHVGKKATLLWTKDKYQSEAKPTLGYFTTKMKLPKGAKVYDSHVYRNTRLLRGVRNHLVNYWLQQRGIKDGKPAAGLMRAMMLVKSGLCTSVDLYGFSTRPGYRGGKYFAKSAIVTKGHTIDFDGWVLSAMVDIGYLCVEGDK